MIPFLFCTKQQSLRNSILPEQIILHNKVPSSSLLINEAASPLTGATEVIPTWYNLMTN